MNSSDLTNAPAHATSDVRRTSSHVVAAKLLQVFLANAVDRSEGGTLQRSTAEQLNQLRNELLYRNFFHPQFRPEELSELRPNYSALLFVDLVVLLARLIRVFSNAGAITVPTEQQQAEYVAVRNACLELPFFDYTRDVITTDMFTADEVDDEGIVVE